MMLTVREAARETGRSPETIRRWIRAGKLPACKVGRRRLIDEADLDVLVGSHRLPLPKEWQTTVTGEPMPDWVSMLRRSRCLHDRDFPHG